MDTLNIGTMTGRGRELADMMERKNVDILCLQETKWKGSKARNIGGGCKIFYNGADGRKNGIGIVLREELAESVLEVKRVSDRLMAMKLEVNGSILNIVSAYAPQVNYSVEEKNNFWEDLDGLIESISKEERIVLGADLNGHVGEGNIGVEEIMGRYGAGTRNKEGSMVVDFGKRMDLAIVNTYFKKKDEHRVTYKSGGKSTQVDYVMCRRRNLKEMCDCKVILNECVAKQHRMVVCKMILMVKKKKAEKVKPKIRWWKLKETSCQEAFRQEVTRILGGKDGLPDEWDKTAEMLRKTAETVLGVTFGKRKGDRETWWWNEEVQKSIKEKKEAKKAWDKTRNENTKKIYKEKKSKTKKAVAMAKGRAYDNLYTRLETKEGEKELYRLARQRDRAGKNVQHVRVIKDENSNVMVNSEAVLKIWKEYFEKLMNEENNRDPRTEEIEVVNEEVNCVSREKVKNALRRMKKGKAVGPDELPVEVWKCMGEMGIKFLTRLFNRLLMGERMPEEWRRSMLIPIYKNKGDAQCCGNYREIKLMSHTMKVWERIIEARLRDRVEISKQQYGFMPGKGTTDAMFL